MGKHKKKNNNKKKLTLDYPIRLFIDKIENIEICAKTFLPIAVKIEVSRLKTLKKKFVDIERLTSQKNKRSVGIIEHRLLNIFDEIRKIKAISQPAILINSLFLTLFSMFDAFTGELVREIYTRKPDIMKKLEYSFFPKDIINYKSTKSLKNAIIDKELDTLRREGYHKQFKILGNRFDVTLTEFENWALFVECCQRRNIMTHCDGKATEQYINICKSEGYKFDEDVKIGDQLDIDENYFSKALSIFYEVGLKLGQVLWRKQFPEELEEADINLILNIYSLLVKEKWELAKNISKFALKDQPKIFDDQHKRIYYVNYAQAYKWSGDNDKANAIISELDWSSCTDEFKLAIKVIKDDFKSASALMNKVGKKSKSINKEAYLEWPLFRAFRESNEFLKSYKKIYRKDFRDELKDRIEKDTEEKTSKKAVMRQ